MAAVVGCLAESVQGGVNGLGDADEAAGFGDCGVHGKALDQQGWFGLVCLFTFDAVVEPAGKAGQRADMGVDGDHVVVAGRRLEPEAAFGHRQDDALLFNVLVDQADTTHQF